MGSSGRKPVKGYMVYLGMHMVICYGPVDAVTEVVIDRKSAWSGSALDTTININQPYLFGGYDKEGGVIGAVDIDGGGIDQEQNAYLVSKLGANVPAFRKVVSAILKQPYLGMSNYLKKWAFRVQRIHTLANGETQWYDAKAAIGTDINPVHIIRECLTDTSWGMGHGAEDIDSTSFEACADTLYAEGMGMSLNWGRGVRLNKFISEIRRHINAALYISRSTGKFVLKLIRDDYSVEDLTVLGDSEIIKVTNFVRLAPSDLTSVVTVIYTNPDNNENATVSARNMALASQQGGDVGVSIEFKGFTQPDVASLIAARELKARSYPLLKVSFVANQAANELNNGDPFIFEYSQYGISGMPMRVTGITFGTLIENTITIEAMEDIFGTSDVTFTSPPSSGWVSLDEDPVPVVNSIIQEAPYWDLVRIFGDDDAQALDATIGYFGITAVQPAGSVINAYLYVDAGSGYAKALNVFPIDMCPSATLVSAITKTQTTFSYENGEDMGQVVVGTYLVLDDEIMVIDSYTTTTITVQRGCSDTVPETHALGSRFFCAQEYFGSDDIKYADSESINVKLATRTSIGVLDIVSAYADNLVFDSRQTRPYPPGQFKVNAEYYPLVADGDIVVTWVGRNRLTQSAALIGVTDGDITPEVGTTYTCRLRDGDTDAIISTQTSISANTHTFTTGVIGDHASLKVELWSVRDGYDSWQTHEHTFYYNTFEFENGDAFQFENDDYFEFN